MFVKICGVTSVDDALLAAGLGADAIGLNFVASSPRKISLAKAKEVVRRLPPEVLAVGIFRDERPTRVIDVATQAGLRVVQLHGRETADDVAAVLERIPNVIRAVSAEALPRLDPTVVATTRLLVDSPDPGSGKPFDWHRLAADPPSVPYLLAGGLDPDNVVDAITLLRPWGVDLASGVESSPGIKDPVKVQRFIANARSVPPLDPMPSTEVFPTRT